MSNKKNVKIAHCFVIVSDFCFLCNFQVFIKELVWNLFGEGNDVFQEGEWTKSIEMYTEALSIADYADSEDICVPTSVLEKLYANRAAAYLNIIPVSWCQLVLMHHKLSHLRWTAGFPVSSLFNGSYVGKEQKKTCQVIIKCFSALSFS